MNAHKIKWDEDELVQAEEDITLNYERIKIKKKKMTVKEKNLVL